VAEETEACNGLATCRAISTGTEIWRMVYPVNWSIRTVLMEIVCDKSQIAFGGNGPLTVSTSEELVVRFGLSTLHN
jgi:hypothetical protein